MPRKYTKIKEPEPEVFRMKAEGKTNREIAEQFGLTREQIKGLINRLSRNEQNVKRRNTPKTKGRAIRLTRILSPNTIRQHYAVNVKTRKPV